MKHNNSNHDLDVQRLLKNISSQDFLNIGMHDIAYIRPVHENGKTRFAIHAANGVPLSVVDTQKDAWAMVFENDLEAVTVQ